MSLLLVIALFCAWPAATAVARERSATDLLPPRGLLSPGFTLDESRSRTVGDAFAEQVYVGPGGRSWHVSVTILPTSESAWRNYVDRQRALGQQNVIVEQISGLGEEAVTINDRVGSPLFAARTFVKAGRTVLSVIEMSPTSSFDSKRSTRILRWMVNQARHIGA